MDVLSDYKKARDSGCGDTTTRKITVVVGTQPPGRLCVFVQNSKRGCAGTNKPWDVVVRTQPPEPVFNYG